MYESIPELKDYAITSDDLFSLKENPGKTLVIGGGYIAVECAGFLRGLGNEVILANRSSFLRVFDKDMAKKVVDQMEEEGATLMENTIIKSVKKLEGERLFEVEVETKAHTGKLYKETFQVNTILMAIGRDPKPESYNADASGIVLDKATRKIIGREIEPERTSVDHIYAVGDVVLGVPELMPVAQKSGKLLARRVHMRLSKNSPSGVKVTEEEIL